MERLLSLGYAGGSRPGRGRTGVTFLDSLRASAQLRFFTSGHAPAAELMDSFGRVRHRWQYSYPNCRRDGALAGHIFAIDTQGATDCWRRAEILPGGHLLAIFEGHGLVRLDAASRPQWWYPGRCHHDLAVAPDGSIWVLTRKAAILPRIHPDQPVLLDAITHLSADGRELGRIDLLTAFERSRYASLLEFAHEAGDIFHTNTLERLDGRAAHRSEIFAEGNFLISLRELNTVAILDPRRGEIVWALTGLWSAQHQPTLLDNGHLLVFDNEGAGGRSRVVEIDPLTQQQHWSFADDATHPLYSKTCGSCQRLASGNTLITESDNGRAIEVSPGGEIVWEYRNPRRTGPNDALVAAILEMVVLPEDYDTRWLTDLP
jgi:hypothetical protein